jgi:hypothetical protein
MSAAMEPPNRRDEMMRTIARNSKLHAEVFAKAHSAIAYTLENQFRGEPIDLEYVHGPMRARVLAGGLGRLMDDGEAGFTLYYHSNWWAKIHAHVTRKPKPVTPQVAALKA